MEVLDSVVIGAGQAGLSTSYHLTRLGVRHVGLGGHLFPSSTHTRFCCRDGPDVEWRIAREAPEEFDLVVTDVRMPQMDGWQLGRRVREEWPGLPVLYISGYDVHQSAPGPHAFLRKPFEADDLLRRVAELLRDRS